MVKFVAKGKIKSGTLKDIAVITAPEEISKTKPDGFEASKGKIKVDVSGSGFKYVEAFGLKVPTTGTIEALDAYLKGDLVYKITGLSLTIAEAMTFTSVDEALQSIFSGDDLIKGSQKNDTLRGYDGNDTLKGRKGNDKLDGGEGDNILNGGKGKDQYIFKSGPETGVSTITKLQAGEKIKVDNAVFDDIGSKGKLDAALFHEGPSATTAAQRFVYDKDSGKLYYDSDGNGGAAQVQFAQLKAGTNLDAGDLFVA
ncbi:calcium-binding protein [Bauldia litoralis]|uniref:Hemolysin-type calcium-binding repeat-containing protein n=1 Tax=Bauldia litoralis TaxID=665467 RepID=A0A1G6CQ90_9HYPH|nr:calcium-binding protein [Bauldia litoralis]SDB34988.1 Hemolysin-type calcium-binding repeat-containing protein [Bauldia litoralis]